MNRIDLRQAGCFRLPLVLLQVPSPEIKANDGHPLRKDGESAACRRSRILSQVTNPAPSALVAPVLACSSKLA